MTNLVANPLDPLRTHGGLAAAYYLRNVLEYRDSNHKIKFIDLLRLAIYRNSKLYRKARIPKRNGKFRTLDIPCDELKEVQRLINKHLLKRIKPLPLPCSFGFYGGNGLQALNKVTRPGQAIFSADIVDAFSNTTARAVYHAFRKLELGHVVCYYLTCLTTWLKPGQQFIEADWNERHSGERIDRLAAKISFGGFRSNDSHKLSDNTCVLPQGAPTSPRLFDICFFQIDLKLITRAKTVNGYYVRFADNLYFSAPEFWRKGKVDITTNAQKQLLYHSPIISSIYQIVQKGYTIWCAPFQDLVHSMHVWSQKFRLHKARLLMPDKDDCLPALGYNVFSDGTIRNKRKFVLRIRMSVFNLQKALELGDFETIFRIRPVLAGQMQFALHDQLPPALLVKATSLLEQASNL